MELTPPLYMLCSALIGIIIGYFLRSRADAEIYQRGYHAGLHRAHTRPTSTRQ